MFHLLALPFVLGFWLLFGLLALPFILLRFVFKLVGAVLLLPFLLLFAVLGLIAGGFAFSLFVLLPFLCVAFFAWFLLRLVVPRPI